MRLSNDENSIHVFWDLDGVIFQYERSAYVGDNPPYAMPGYFKNRELDQRAYLILETMRDNCHIDGMHILSRGATRLNPQQRRGVIADKRFNVANDIPWMQSKDVIITERSKVDEAVRFLGRPLSVTDILIDDFNENLKLWVAAGGSAIKYLNGLNSMDTYSGPKIVGMSLIDVPEKHADLYAKILRGDKS